MKLEAMAISSLVGGGLAAIAAIAGALGLGLAALANKGKTGQQSSTKSRPMKNGGYRAQNMNKGVGIRKGFLNGVRDWFGRSENDQITGNNYEYDTHDNAYSDYPTGSNFRRSGEPYSGNYRIERRNSKKKKRSLPKRNPARDEEALDEWQQAKMKEDQMMELVRAQDSSKCGLKLICELASLNDEQLTYDHLAMLDLVGPSILIDNGPIPPEDTFSKLDARTQYKLARGVGAKGYNCSKYFPTCPVKDIVGLIDQILP